MSFSQSVNWYHGSPLVLTTLLAGSTVTQNRELAEAFSHKPTVLCIDDDGAITHNGSQLGYLYLLDEVIGESDVNPHPNSSMALGLEYVTSRDIVLRLIGQIQVDEDSLLTEEQLARLLPK